MPGPAALALAFHSSAASSACSCASAHCFAEALRARAIAPEPHLLAEAQHLNDELLQRTQIAAVELTDAAVVQLLVAGEHAGASVAEPSQPQRAAPARRRSNGLRQTSDQQGREEQRLIMAKPMGGRSWVWPWPIASSRSIAITEIWADWRASGESAGADLRQLDPGSMGGLPFVVHVATSADVAGLR